MFLTEVRGIGVEKRWSPLTVVAAWDVDTSGYILLYGDIREVISCASYLISIHYNPMINNITISRSRFSTPLTQRSP